jgi:hypothetical protein
MLGADHRDPKPILTCSLCGKGQLDVNDLSSGPTVFM